MAAKRQVSYQWRLREVMAAAGLFNASRPGAAAGRAGHHAVVGAGVAAGHPDPGAAVAAGAGGAVRHLRRHPRAADRHPRRERPGPPPRRQQRRRRQDGVTDLNALRPARAKLRPGP